MPKAKSKPEKECSFHSCKETANLKKCLYCKKYYCDTHIKPKPTGTLTEETNAGFAELMRDENAHPDYQYREYLVSKSAYNKQKWSETLDKLAGKIRSYDEEIDVSSMPSYSKNDKKILEKERERIATKELEKDREEIRKREELKELEQKKCAFCKKIDNLYKCDDCEKEFCKQCGIASAKICDSCNELRNKNKQPLKIINKYAKESFKETSNKLNKKSFKAIKLPHIKMPKINYSRIPIKQILVGLIAFFLLINYDLIINKEQVESLTNQSLLINKNVTLFGQYLRLNNNFIQDQSGNKLIITSEIQNLTIENYFVNGTYYELFGIFKGNSLAVLSYQDELNYYVKYKKYIYVNQNIALIATLAILALLINLLPYKTRNKKEFRFLSWFLIHSFSIGLIGQLLPIFNVKDYWSSIIFTGIGVSVIAQIVRSLRDKSKFLINLRFMYWITVHTIAYGLTDYLMNYLKINYGWANILIIGFGISVISEIAKNVQIGSGRSYRSSLSISNIPWWLILLIIVGGFFALNNIYLPYSKKNIESYGVDCNDGKVVYANQLGGMFASITKMTTDMGLGMQCVEYKTSRCTPICINNTAYCQCEATIIDQLLYKQGEWFFDAMIR